MCPRSALSSLGLGPRSGRRPVPVDWAFILRERDGSTRVFHDTSSEGLFPRSRWLTLLADVGFAPRSVPLTHSEVEPGLHEMFVGSKPRPGDIVTGV